VQVAQSAILEGTEVNCTTPMKGQIGMLIVRSAIGGLDTPSAEVALKPWSDAWTTRAITRIELRDGCVANGAGAIPADANRCRTTVCCSPSHGGADARSKDRVFVP